MDYKQAKTIREKSFGTLLAEQEGGFGSSLKSALSQKSKARAAGLKEKFDPLNIAKTLTGGSNWAPAMLGKLFNVDKKRVDYFSGVKPKSTANLESSESLNSPEAIECLGYIYKSLKQSAEDKKLANEQKRNKLEEEESEEESRNQEIVKALTARFGKKKGEKEKPYRDEKGRFTKKPTEETPKKTGGKTTETPSVFKSNPARTTTPFTSSASSVAVTSTTAMVSSAAIVAGTVALTTATAIGAAESGGNYNITFGDRVDKSGKIVNSKGYITPEQVFGKKLTEMTLSEVKEFGRMRSANSPNSGATGKYQFMPSTLFGNSKAPGLVQKLGLSMDTKFTPEVQDKLQELLHTQDVAILRKKGVPITPGYEYMAHYIGAGGATVVYNSVKRGENVTVAESMISAGLTAPGKQNNPELYTIRVADFEGILANRLMKKGLASPHAAGAQTGNKIDSSSKENKNLKADVAASNDKAAPVVSSTNVNSQQQQTPQSSPQGNDKPAYINKVRM
jgi:muramidase (phage lysozyme)